LRRAHGKAKPLANVVARLRAKGAAV
jgi:hypothetical protein